MQVLNIEISELQDHVIYIYFYNGNYGISFPLGLISRFTQHNFSTSITVKNTEHLHKNY